MGSNVIMSKTNHHLLVNLSVFFTQALFTKPPVPLGSGLSRPLSVWGKVTSESRVLSPWCWDHIERFEATLSQVTPCPTTSPSQCRKRNGWLQSPSSPDVAGWWPLLSVDTNVPLLLWLLIAFPLFLPSLEVHWLPTLVWHQAAIPFLLCRQCTVGGQVLETAKGENFPPAPGLLLC